MGAIHAVQVKQQPGLAQYLMQAWNAQRQSEREFEQNKNSWDAMQKALAGTNDEILNPIIAQNQEKWKADILNTDINAMNMQRMIELKNKAESGQQLTPDEIAEVNRIRPSQAGFSADKMAKDAEASFNSYMQNQYRLKADPLAKRQLFAQIGAEQFNKNKPLGFFDAILGVAGKAKSPYASLLGL